MEDPVDETLSHMSRATLMAASRLGQEMARRRAEIQRRVEAESQQRAREMSTRLEAERGLARDYLGRTRGAEWWRDATPVQVGHAWEVAVAWRDTDPVARDAAETIAREVRERHGVDVEALEDARLTHDAARLIDERARQPEVADQAQVASAAVAAATRQEEVQRTQVLLAERVGNREWWQEACPRDVGDLWAAAYAWSAYDDQVREWESELRGQIVDRWGEDLEIPDDASPEEVATILDQRDRTGQDVADLEAQELFAGDVAADAAEHADRLEHQARQETDYGLAEADRLQQVGRDGGLDERTVTGAVYAAKGNARPAREAVQGESRQRRPARGRSALGRNRGRGDERGLHR